VCVCVCVCVRLPGADAGSLRDIREGARPAGAEGHADVSNTHGEWLSERVSEFVGE
jgi:hypothetical protein